MSHATIAAMGSTLPEIRIDMIDFWTVFRETHFPGWFSDKNQSAKWVEKFNLSPTEKIDVIKITEYDMKQAKGLFFELVEGSFSSGYKYRNQYARILYYYKFNKEDVENGILHATAWTHSSKGAETGYYMRLTDLIQVSEQPLSVSTAEPANFVPGILDYIRKSSSLVTSSLSKPDGYAAHRVEPITTESSPRFSASASMKSTAGVQVSVVNTPYPVVPPVFEDAYTEKGDDHMTKMTMRDNYCIIHNIPLSNKPWLNQLISDGRTWQQQLQQQ